MKICLLTDLHIDFEGNHPLNIDTRSNFLQVLDHIYNKKYDLMVLAGDLCNKSGGELIYQWIKAQLKPIEIPIKIISGNHDTSTLIAQIFDYDETLKNDELYYTHRIHGNNLIFLDTAKGEMSENQWNWLSGVTADGDNDIYIFMHHPPLIAGSLHMEPTYSFKQMERFEAFCKSKPDKRFYIFTGHYHFERSIIKQNMSIFITPSTFIQIDPDSSTFQPLSRYIGYREIHINGQQGFNTNVVYLE
ncbi:MAG: metallophosphoesterase family protein [Saprospiraceae bacterium]|nr:metallophosphoesterase family protein [Saprospiraceae bacterium]